MNEDKIKELNELINDELDLVKSFVSDRVKIITNLKDRLMEELS